MVTRGRLAALALAAFASASAAVADPRDRLEIVVAPRAAPPVVGEQVEATIRGEYGFTILRQEIELPKGGDFEWVQLDRDAWRRERVDGRAVAVVERRLALFPKRAGPLRFGPVGHRLVARGAGGREEVLEFRATPVAIAAAAYPADGAETLSAAALTLTDELDADPAALADGETLERTVRIVALGALPQMLPPRPEMRQPWLISFAAPEERSLRVTPDGPVSTIIWRWSLRPKTGEPGVLPEIRIPWFDTEAREMRRATIPAIPFGYGSFGRNSGGGARFGPGAVAALAAAAALGLASGLLVLSIGGRPASRSELAAALRRRLPSASLRAMRRAARRGDLAVFRAAAAEHLRRRAAPSPEARSLLDLLDARLFRPAAAPGRPSAADQRLGQTSDRQGEGGLSGARRPG